MKILIVDDSSSLREVIRNALSSLLPSAEILEAANGIEAEAILQESYFNNAPVELIFLDWMMPGVDGRTFLSKIRAVEHFKETPEVIMLTAETYPEQINAILKYNVAAYVTKPFSANDLQLAIDSIKSKTKKVG